MNYIVNSYENYKEEDRLTTNNSKKIEFLTTVKAFENILPKKAKILDCAAGTGIYAFYLADKGHDVTATDITPRHINYIDEMLKCKPYKMFTKVLDATDMKLFEDETFDIVLNMGPFYHIIEENQRDKCMKECLRVLKKDGLLATSYISRFAVFPYVSLADNRFLKDELANQLIGTGVLKHNDPNCFWTDTYYASPDEMEGYYKDNSLEIVDHFAQDGILPMFKSVAENWTEAQFKTWCEYHYLTCREKSTLGSSNHVMIIGKK